MEIICLLFYFSRCQVWIKKKISVIQSLTACLEKLFKNFTCNSFHRTPFSWRYIKRGIVILNSFFVRYLSAIQSTKYSVLQLYVAFSFLGRQIVNSELWRLDGSVWIHSDKDDQKRTHQCQFSCNSGCERFRRGAVRVHRVKVIDFLVCHSITSHSTRYNG